MRSLKKKELNLTRSFSEFAVVDPLEIPFPMLKMPLHFYPDPSQAPSYLLEVNERIKAADAYVLVSAEYNYSIPPALSNMLDHFPMSSYAFKPTGIAVYSMGKSRLCMSHFELFPLLVCSDISRFVRIWHIGH